MRRPCYNPTTGEFLGLHDTLGFIVCCGDEEGHFLLYGYDENKSKLLYFFYKCRIPNCFGGTMFERHRLMFESGELEGDASRFYFFLPSICDCNKEINYPIDINEKEYCENFDPSKRDYNNSEKSKMTEAVVNMTKNCSAFKYKCSKERKCVIKQDAT